MRNEQRREVYKDNKVKTYQELKNYFFSQYEINYKRNCEIPTITKEINDFRVWILFASNDGNEWDAVQVAHSKNEVYEEVEFALAHLYSNEYNTGKYKLKNSQFYENICPSVEKKSVYRNVLYSKIGAEYSMVKICFLNVDDYLTINSRNTKNINDIERIIGICKNQYAEAKLAYQTLAAYWRKVSSAIDGQTIAYAVEHKEEFEV